MESASRHQTSMNPPPRRLLLAAAASALIAGWLAYHDVGGPSQASASAPLTTNTVEPLPRWDQENLDRQTDAVLNDWSTALEQDTTRPPGLAIRANLFEAARTQQVDGPTDTQAFNAAMMLRVQSIIAVGEELRCTIDGKLRRVGDDLLYEGVPFTITAIGTTQIEVDHGEATFRIPVRL